MSLSIAGVWQVDTWNQTVWADGVWREGDAVANIVEGLEYTLPSNKLHFTMPESTRLHYKVSGDE